MVLEVLGQFPGAGREFVKGILVSHSEALNLLSRQRVDFYHGRIRPKDKKLAAWKDLEAFPPLEYAARVGRAIAGRIASGEPKTSSWTDSEQDREMVRYLMDEQGLVGMLASKPGSDKTFRRARIIDTLRVVERERMGQKLVLQQEDWTVYYKELFDFFDPSGLSSNRERFPEATWL